MEGVEGAGGGGVQVQGCAGEVAGGLQSRCGTVAGRCSWSPQTLTPRVWHLGCPLRCTHTDNIAELVGCDLQWGPPRMGVQQGPHDGHHTWPQPTVRWQCDVKAVLFTTVVASAVMSTPVTCTPPWLVRWGPQSTPSTRTRHLSLTGPPHAIPSGPWLMLFSTFFASSAVR